MAKSYLRLENSPFEFVNSNDPNRELIFRPTHTRSAAKSEMKASAFPSGKGSILRVTMFGPWNALLPKRSIQANGFLMDSPRPCLELLEISLASPRSSLIGLSNTL